MEETSFSILPNEIWIKIFFYVPVRYQRNVRLVSKHCKELMDYEFKKKTFLKISQSNLKEVKELVDNRSLDNFGNLQLDEIDITDAQYIIEKIDLKLAHLSVICTDFLPTSSDNLKYLKSLQLHQFNYSNDFRLSELSFLEHFDLVCCHLIFTNELLSQLAKNPTRSLKTLKVDDEYDDKFLIDVLMTHTTIEDLEISKPKDYKIHENMWQKVFANLKNLRKLDISSKGDWLNFVIQALSQETPLQHIVIDKCYSDGILKKIRSKWKDSLESITFKLCLLTDLELIEVTNFTKLRVFNLDGCWGLTSDGFLNAIAKKPNLILEELKLNNSVELRGSDLHNILERLPNLRVLSLSGLGIIYNNGILEIIFQYCKRLRVLHIETRGITDEGILGYGENPQSIKRLHELEELDLHCSDKLTDRCLSAFKFPELRTLNLKYCNKITLKGLELLGKNCPSLETLGISADSILGRNSVQIIENRLKMLRSSHVSKEGIFTAKDRYKLDSNLSKLRKGISLHVN